MQEIHLTTQFGTVYGKAAGEPGNAVVLGIHGWSQRNGWHSWSPLLEPLAEVGFYAVSVDMPGWGQSVLNDKQPRTGKWAIESVLDILDILRVEDAPFATLMGKSWGGGVALEFALKYPDWCQKLILTAPAYQGDLAALAQLPQPVLLAWAEDDPVIPISFAQQVAAAIPHCTLITYPTGGHSAAMNNAADFAPKAITFLGKLAVTSDQ